MSDSRALTIKKFHDYQPAELFAIFRHIYLSSDFMSDDFDMKFDNVRSFEIHFLSILKKPGSFIFIANSDARPVAYLVVETNEAQRLKHTANLSMGVAEQFRGKGIGRYLINEGIKKARTDGIIEIIYLMVRADHTGALKLYQDTGFDTLAILEKDTKIENEYFDGILMRRFV